MQNSVNSYDQGLYRAVKEFYSPKNYSLYPRTYEGSNQGIDLAKFGFKIHPDSVIIYALPYSDVACLKRLTAATVDSLSDSSFILVPTKKMGLYLHFRSMIDQGYPGFRISLVIRRGDLAYIENAYSYVPGKFSIDSVCHGDSVDFVWSTGD